LPLEKKTKMINYSGIAYYVSIIRTRKHADKPVGDLMSLLHYIAAICLISYKNL